MPLQIKTSVFEGPLDLLLELIEKKKLLINDISLAQVADDFIAYINTHPELPIGETADFIALAATLLLIKSRSLLPNLALTDDESKDIKELEYRLALYQLIKEAAHMLGKSDFPRLHELEPPPEEPLYIPAPEATATSLRAAAQMLIEGFPQNLTLPKVEVKRIMSLEDMVGRLSTRISDAFRMSFKEFSSNHPGSAKGEKSTVIVSFLALLELVKQGIIKAEQQGDDIHMEKDAVSTPTYGTE
ncbi:MAG: ScpA family protein [Patescibacteria group bacterium]